MNLKPLFLVVFLALVGLSYQNETDNQISDETALVQTETAELDIIISDAINFPVKVESKSEAAVQSIKKAIRYVQNAVKKCLDSIAHFVLPIAYQDNLDPEITSAIGPNNEVIRSTFYHQLDVSLRRLKQSIDKKADNLINVIDNGVNNFNMRIKKFSEVAIHQFTQLKKNNPGLLSKQCSQMIRDLKSTLSVISGSFLRCATKSFFTRTMAHDLIFEDIVRKVEFQKSEFVRTYECITTTEGNKIKKIMKCVKLRNLWDAYQFYKEITANVDNDLSNALDGLEKSLTFVGCVNSEIKGNGNEDKFWDLVHSTVSCSSDLSSDQAVPSTTFRSIAGEFIKNNKKDPASQGTLYPFYISNQESRKQNDGAIKL